MNPSYPEQLLSQAEQLCQQRNVRLTPQRMEVLRLMVSQKGSVSAYGLLDLLRVSEPQAKPPTIYRALDFLLEQGFIHRVESTNSYVVCHHFNEPQHNSAMLICDHCGIVRERHMAEVEKVLSLMARHAEFTLRHSVIEAHGICGSCREMISCHRDDDSGHDPSQTEQNSER